MQTGSDLLLHAREQSGLSQTDLATRAGTSRPTLSAYEHNRKSPSLETAIRVLSHARFGLALTPLIEFEDKLLSRGRTTPVPSRLPALPVSQTILDVWDDLVIPRDVRAAWTSVVTAA